MPTLVRGDVALHYAVDGRDDAPPLVMSNSLGTDLAMWAPQMDALATTFRVLRYDTRGHGRSSVPPGPYAIDQLGGDVLALLDHLGIARAHVCGLSMGGLTGMWLAIHAPERVDRLVLANTGARIGGAEFWNARIDAIRAEVATSGGDRLPDRVVAAVIDRWFTKRFQQLAPSHVARVAAMLRATAADGYVANSEAIRDADLRDGLRSIAAPTLVVAGTHDPSTPPQLGRDIAAAVPGAEYVEFDAAHLSNIEQAGAFSAALLRFLTGGAITEPARRAIGETMRRSVLGDAHVDRSAGSTNDFNGDLRRRAHAQRVGRRLDATRAAAPHAQPADDRDDGRAEPDRRAAAAPERGAQQRRDARRHPRGAAAGRRLLRRAGREQRVPSRGHGVRGAGRGALTERAGCPGVGVEGARRWCAVPRPRGQPSDNGAARQRR